MTRSYTTPVSPTLSNIDLPVPITIDVPDLPTSSLSVDTFSADPVNARLVAYTYARYADTIQSVIDGNLDDLFDWTGDTAIATKTGILKENLLYPAQLKAKQVLRKYAALGWPQLPGQAKKDIYDIETEAKHELAAALWKLFEDEVKVSNDHINFALQAGTASEVALFDHHHKIQSINLETTIEITTNLYRVYEANAKAFNLQITEFQQAIENHQRQREAKLLDHEAYLAHLDSIITDENKNIRDAELFNATIEMVNLENAVKLSTIKLAEIAANISKAGVQGYHAELQTLLANIDTITAGYRAYRATVKQELYDKDAYLKRLEAQRMDIQNYEQLIEQDKKQAKLDLATAHANLQMFKNSIEEFSAMLGVQREKWAVTESDYQNTLIEYGTTIRDALSTAINEFEEGLATITTGTEEDLSMADLQVSYNVKNYISWIKRLITAGQSRLQAESMKERARLEAASQLRTTLTMDHYIQEGGA
ncbi:MAG: hypothetical protein KKD77_24270 [Gammaproteobacteria bacterium]|nr:hypothetical protein [Gammaproteobacteria bacterium]